MTSGIYQITNRENGKRYIGSAVNLKKRWQNHLSGLCRGRHENQHLQRAFHKYGESAFAFTVLERVENSEQLIPREQHFIDSMNPEYNIAPIAGSSLGRQHSPETRRKISDAHRGERNHNYGKQPTAATRRKMSEAHKGKPHPRKGCSCSSETRKKISQALKGRHLSEETKRKISEATIGKRNPNWGRHPSAETQRKMSEAHKAYWCRIHTGEEMRKRKGR